MTKLLAILSITLLLFSCASRSYVESFYHSKGVQQYFVRPSSLKGDEIKMKADFTYRNLPDSKTSLNFTFITKTKPKLPIKSMFLYTENDTIPVEDITTLIQKHSKRTYRYSSLISNKGFQQVVFAQKTKVAITFSDERVYTLEPEKDFEKSMAIAQEDIIFKN